MEGLPVHYGDVTGITVQRYGIRELFGTVIVFDPGLNIDFAFFVRAGYHPKAASGGGVVKLYLEVKAVDARIPLWVVPVRYAILMPGNGTAEPGLFNEGRIVIGNEVIAIDDAAAASKSG